MIKILLLLTFSLMSCAGTVKEKYNKTIDYNNFQKKLEKKLPNAQINIIDSTKSIELEAWNNIKNAENYKHIEVKKGRKLHIIKHTETSLLNTSFEAVLYNNNDTLACSSTAPFLDPIGHDQYILNLINDKNLEHPKSHLFFSLTSLLSTTGGTKYLTLNNPLFSNYKANLIMSTSAIGDISLIVGILSYNDVIEQDSKNKPLGNSFITIAILSRVITLIANGYITEFNAYYNKTK